MNSELVPAIAGIEHNFCALSMFSGRVFFDNLRPMRDACCKMQDAWREGFVPGGK